MLDDKMDHEAIDAPINHIKISNATKEGIIEKLIELQAFEEKTAIQKEHLLSFGYDDFAFIQLVHEGAILEKTIDDIPYYYLSEEYKPRKSYRKVVVMGLSIPILLFLGGLILAGLIAIIYGIISYFTN